MRKIIALCFDGEPVAAYSSESKALAVGRQAQCDGRRVDLLEVPFMDDGGSAEPVPALAVRRPGAQPQAAPQERYGHDGSEVIHHVHPDRLPAHLRPPVPVAAPPATKPCPLGCGRQMNVADPRTFCEHCAADLQQVAGWPSNPPAPPTPGAEFK